ncbi:MAG: hypothetical protein KAW91_03465, partial [candidate division Zixibacteria bacterium]|nr:hypothetical protein [candidate division Zixibacteria bacterium]
MHKTAVAYAVGKLMQVMGLVLLVPLGIAIYDNRALDPGELFFIPEVFGFIEAIVLSLVMGTILAVLCRGGRDLQGIKEGYAIVTIGWFSLAFVASIPLCLY